ncbi:MAG TPA: chemotaxis protein CheW [Vicinamibacterales bacterium]|jgi:chemotaxis-related protein WspB|nr:chemotaxis protein CheW [Vicinamibacterales bacterium]
MLYLLLEVAGQHYAVEATRVVEVLPLVQVTVIPRAPTEVAGVFSFRGRPVPLIDLRRLTLRRPARPKFSTRIILVSDRAEDGAEHLLGIIAERVTETTRRAPDDFKDTGFSNAATPYLGGVATTADGLVQRLDVQRLLPPATREMLFASASTSA